MDPGSRNGSLAPPLARGQHVVAVAALIVRADPHDLPRVLAMRRAPSNLAGPGLWETVSGRIEHGEEPLAAITREVDEECGLTVEIEPRPYACYAAQRRGLPMIVILFRARYLGGEVRVSEEHDQYAWLSAREFGERSSLLPLVEVIERVLTESL
jgi:8-oxo-dGTP diphosphatase